MSSGKVRELFVPDVPSDDQSVILMVATDRISAYDFVLDTVIPDKGVVLNRLSLWWFEQLADVVPNDVIGVDEAGGVPAAVVGRAMVCRRLEMFPIECVARGYLTGSGLADYRATGAVGGNALPAGLQDGSRLPEPIFTPATKAEIGEHDENIDFEGVVARCGADVAVGLRALTLAVYSRAEAIARERGVILADTKFEFGVDPGGIDPSRIVLGDEVLTPDSSRFWDAEAWRPGQAQPSFDKQFVRDWLTQESGWDRASGERPPALPDEIVEKTRARYVEAFERITGETF